MGVKNIADTEGQEKWQQLLVLRAMSARTGVLHSAQVLQLKIWPRLLFQTSTSSTFKVNIKKKTLVFEVEITGKPFVPGKGERVIRPQDAPEVLDAWVKSLLGDDWDISIHVTATGGKRKGEVRKFHYAAKPVQKETIEDLCERLVKQDKAKARS